MLQTKRERRNNNYTETSRYEDSERTQNFRTEQNTVIPGTIGVGTQSMDLANLQYGQSIALEGRKEAIRKLYRHGKIGRRAFKTALKQVGKKVKSNGSRRRQKKRKNMRSEANLEGRGSACGRA